VTDSAETPQDFWKNSLASTDMANHCIARARELAINQTWGTKMQDLTISRIAREGNGESKVSGRRLIRSISSPGKTYIVKARRIAKIYMTAWKKEQRALPSISGKLAEWNVAWTSDFRGAVCDNFYGVISRIELQEIVDRSMSQFEWIKQLQRNNVTSLRKRWLLRACFDDEKCCNFISEH